MWAVVVGAALVAGAATLTGVLVGGPPARQVLAGLAVAALAAVGCAVPLWHAQRQVRHLRSLEQAAARFATVLGDDAPDAALGAAVEVLVPDARLVALHLGGPTTDLRGLARVVVDDAVATGLPAEVPDGTTGRETARLLALPLAIGGRGRGAVLLRVQHASPDDVVDVQRLLVRVTPALTALAMASPASRAGSIPSVASSDTSTEGPVPAAGGPPPSDRTPAAGDRPPVPPPPPATAAAGDGDDGGDGGDGGDARLRELVARGAHDLRTPLNTLTGMVDTLVRHGDELTPSQREQFHAALQRSTRRIAGWIIAMLDAAVDQRTGPTHVEPCRLQPLLEEAVTISHAATAGLDVYVAPTDLRVVADPGGIVRVVGNLLANAGHHAQAGNTVEVEACPRGDQVEVCVRDHGDGWGKGASSNGQTSEGGGHHSGLGLGLASVRSQVASWGGEIELEETPGGGATVCFTLPRALGAQRPRDESGAGWTIAGGESHIRGAQHEPHSAHAGRGDGPHRPHRRHG